MTSLPDRLKRRVPQPIKKLGKRALGIADPVTRIEVTCAHIDSELVLTGRYRQGVRVVALQARDAKAGSTTRVVYRQEPSEVFEFHVDVAELAERLTDPEGTYDFFVEVLDGPEAKKTTLWRFGAFATTRRNEAVAPIVFDGRTAWTHVTGQGNISLFIGEVPINRLSSHVIKLTTSGTVIDFEMELTTYSRPAASFTGQLVGRMTGSVHTFDVSVTDVGAEKNYGLYKYRVEGRYDVSVLADLPDDDSESIYDPHVLVHLADIEIPRRALLVKNGKSSIKLKDLAIDRPDGVHLLAPYLTFRGSRLAFWSERLDDEAYRYLQRASWFSWAFAPLRPFSGIWLVGEIPYKAQDNGYHFFRWLRANYPQRRAYYVIDKNSPDRDRVEPLGNVVYQHSKEHIKYSMLASRFVGSHHAEYLYGSRSKRVQRRSRGLRVFLQHGVTGAKNVTLNYGRRKTNESPADVFIVNSELERKIVIEELEYLPSQVKVTGFTRFDELFNNDTALENRIIVMPTWRDWLVQARYFEETAFAQQWLAFLKNSDVVAAARAKGYSIELVLHPNLRKFIGFFEESGVTILPQGADIQHLLKSSRLLITDYSSVAWDFAFLDKPVLYFQFDFEAFTNGRRPFIDYATDLPGDICRTADELATATISLIDQDLAQNAEHRRRAHAMLDHFDQNHNARTYDVVKNADGVKARLTRLRSTPTARATFNTFRKSKRYHGVMTLVFRFAQLLPRKDTMVFESDRGRSWGGSPRAIQERLTARGEPLQAIAVHNTPQRIPDLAARKVRRFSPRYYWEMGRARFWVFNQNAADQFKPRGRTHFLQTWHGTPLKKMQNDVPVMHGRDDNYHERAQMLVDQWTSLVSPSPYATEAFTSAFGFTGQIIESGYPCNDIFHSPEREARAQAARVRLGIPTDRKIVLYAPTFRDNQRRGVHWSADLRINLDDFKDRFGQDTTLLIRFHPLVRFKWAPGDLDEAVIDASTYPDAQDLLLIADVLITDYSSIMFDYAQTGRPMLFYTYDIELYRDTLRGFYFDFENESPGPLVRTSEEVLDALGDLDAVTAEWSERREAFRARFGGLEDGHASDRVLDAVLDTAKKQGKKANAPYGRHTAI